MIKLLYSTFAMSLILLTPMVLADSAEDVLKLQKEVVPNLIGPQGFTPPDLYQQKNWQVTPDQVEQDVASIKDQGRSLIDWENKDPEQWLDIGQWIAERDVKDKTPDWKQRLRNERHLELVGNILQCNGICQVMRGTSGAKVQHLSRLYEGDELKTEKDSVAWVYLIDGTLLRLSSESSVSLQEINWSQSEVFFLVRLNAGHIFWHPRSKEDYPEELGPETDVVGLPLLVRQANGEFFERQLYQKQKSMVVLSSFFDHKEEASKSQIKRINELKKTNGSLENFSTKVMMVAPNATLISSRASFDLVYTPGGKGFFKKRTSQIGEEFSLHLRGYKDTEVRAITESKWHEVDNTGRSYNPLTDVQGHLQIMELLTKRIKTFELAREIWLGEFTIPLLNVLNDPKTLANKYGYVLWGMETRNRQDFLVEYTRRIETTNLRSLENLLEKLSANGEKISRELSSVHYQDAINHYLLGLKTMYTDKKLKIREMNDLQFYAWILKNGKI